MRMPVGDSGSDTARSRTIPAPIGGWNAVDSVVGMASTDAVYLDNLFPRTSDVQLRLGNQQVAALPMGEEIRTLMGYKSTAAVAKLFAASQHGIFDVTAGDAAVAVTPCTNGAWQYENITTAGGSFMLCCNGVDKMKLYDGATWKDLDGTSTPAITGISTTDVVNIAKFKTRAILCKKDSLSFFYLPNNAIAGAATEFPLGAVFHKGGYLMATTTWTVDGGNGPDDYFVAITSEGEVAVYKGNDPSLSDQFALVGIFQLSAPMGRRCFVKLADDTAVITRSAVYPLAKSLRVSDTDKRVGLTRKIQRVFAETAEKHKDLFGWQVLLYPEASMLIVNVPFLNFPDRNIVYSWQFVMNTMTGAWCRFTNQHSEAWLAFDGKLYFALHNRVNQAWNGESDRGAPVVGKAKTAFSSLGTGRQKQVKMVRPIFQANRDITLQLGIDVDYADNVGQTSKASYTQSLSLWDDAVWNYSVWNGSSLTIARWRSVNAKLGRTAALRLRVSAKDVSMLWIATDLLVEDGGLM